MFGPIRVRTWAPLHRSWSLTHSYNHIIHAEASPLRRLYDFAVTTAFSISIIPPCLRSKCQERIIKLQNNQSLWSRTYLQQLLYFTLMTVFLVKKPLTRYQLINYIKNILNYIKYILNNIKYIINILYYIINIIN